MNEEAVCAHIKDMYLKIPASDFNAKLAELLDSAHAGQEDGGV